MKSGLFPFLSIFAGCLWLLACSGNPAGISGPDAGSADGPSGVINQLVGPVERPPFTAEMDPVDDLRARCAAYLDPLLEYPEGEIPEDCLGLYRGSHWRILGRSGPGEPVRQVLDGPAQMVNENDSNASPNWDSSALLREEGLNSLPPDPSLEMIR